MKINLGSRVRDRITGFEGIVVGRTEYLYGCARLVVQPEKIHDGKPVENQYFDEQQMDLIETDAVKIGDTTIGGQKTNTPPPR